MKPGALAAVLLSVAGAGCEGVPASSLEREGGTSGRCASLVRGVADDGRTVFVSKIDGTIEDVVPGGFLRGEDHAAVLVGCQPGADQGSVVFVSRAGERRASLLCPTPRRRGGSPDAPDDIAFPRVGTLRTIDVGDRRFLALATCGDYSTVALVVAEVLPDDRIEERAVVWHVGHITHVATDGRWIACAGYDGESPRAGGPKRASLFAVDLTTIAARASSGGGVVEDLAASGLGRSAAPSVVAVHASLPTETVGGEEVDTVSVEGRTATLRLNGGLVWIVGLDGDRRVESALSDDYVSDYPTRRLADPSLPPDPRAHARALAATVVVRR